MWQENKAEGKEQDESKGVEMAGDFEGSLHDMQADPEADDQEQEEEGQERMDQVPSLPWLQQQRLLAFDGKTRMPFLHDFSWHQLLLQPVCMVKLAGWQGSPDTPPPPTPCSPPQPSDPLLSQP